MQPVGKFPVIIAVAALALQPIVVMAKPCACRTPDATASVQNASPGREVRGDNPSAPHSCCAQRNDTVATAGERVDHHRGIHAVSCSLKSSIHALGECCCVTKAPAAATLPSVVATIESPTAHAIAYLPTLAEDFSETPRLSTLRFGSPAELAYSSHPTLSILYCVWRN